MPLGDNEQHGCAHGGRPLSVSAGFHDPMVFLDGGVGVWVPACLPSDNGTLRARERQSLEQGRVAGQEVREVGGGQQADGDRRVLAVSWTLVVRVSTK